MTLILVLSVLSALSIHSRGASFALDMVGTNAEREIDYVLQFTSGIVVAEAIIDSPECKVTPIPDLYDNWRRDTAQNDLGRRDGIASDEEFNQYVKSVRESRINGLSNVFINIIKMTQEQREAMMERVLWEHDEIMVLVDRFSTVPKALIIPKKEGIWLLTDAPLDLRDEIARVAAATSDSFIEAAGKACKESETSNILTHTPKGLGQQQLHVHVQPKWSLQRSESAGEFYEDVSERLRVKLSDVKD